MTQPTIQWDIIEKPDNLTYTDVSKLIDDLHYNRLIECNYADAPLNRKTIEITYKYKGNKETISPLKYGTRYDYPNINSSFKIFLSANTGQGSMFDESQFRYIWQEIMLDFNRRNENYPVEPFDYI